MANQKAELHNINLKTSEVNLNKYKSDIKPYSGFRKNNSPFYGNVLSPFYGKTFPAIGTNSCVTKDGYIYSLKNGSLFVQKDDDKLQLSHAQAQNSRFIIKHTMAVSGNSTYSTILGYFQVSNDYKMLCTSNEGVYAIINSDGTVLYEWPNVEAESRYQPSEKVHFTEYAGDDNTYCFAVGSYAYFVINGELIRDSFFNRASNMAFGCVRNNGHFIICRRDTDLDLSDILTTNITGPNYFTRVDTVRLIYNNTYQDFTGILFGLFFNKNESVSFTSKDWLITDEGFALTGDNVAYINNTTISIRRQINYSSGIEVTNYDNLSSIFSNYGNFSLLGYSSYSTMHHPALTKGKKYIIKEIQYWNGKEYKVTKKEVTATEDVAAYDEHIPRGYHLHYLDADNQRHYKDVPVTSDNVYPGGVFSTIEDNVRALYHGGELVGISIANDKETIGTLLCTMSEIDSNYPITVKREGY